MFHFILLDIYRPQRGCGRVMFLHVSVILFTGGRQVPVRETSPDRAPLPDTAPLCRALLLFLYSYCQRRVLGSRSLLVVYILLLPNLREVPHGTKGTGPKFITRPVYLRSQFRNNMNTVSSLVLLIHLLQVLCTWYAGIAHHRVLQTSGRGWEVCSPTRPSANKPMNYQQRTNPRSYVRVVYIAGDTLRHQPMGADHMMVLQLRGPMAFHVL